MRPWHVATTPMGSRRHEDPGPETTRAGGCRQGQSQRQTEEPNEWVHGKCSPDGVFLRKVTSSAIVMPSSSKAERPDGNRIARLGLSYAAFRLNRMNWVKISFSRSVTGVKQRVVQLIEAVIRSATTTGTPGAGAAMRLLSLSAVSRVTGGRTWTTCALRCPTLAAPGRCQGCAVVGDLASYGLEPRRVGGSDLSPIRAP